MHRQRTFVDHKWICGCQRIAVRCFCPCRFHDIAACFTWFLRCISVIGRIRFLILICWCCIIAAGCAAHFCLRFVSVGPVIQCDPSLILCASGFCDRQLASHGDVIVACDICVTLHDFPCGTFCKLCIRINIRSFDACIDLQRLFRCKACAFLDISRCDRHGLFTSVIDLGICFMHRQPSLGYNRIYCL